MCCPQLEATLLILIGQTSKETNVLALNGTHAEHCLLMLSKFWWVRALATDDLKQICSIHPSNLTEASCPVKDVSEFESTVDSSKLLSACEKIDPAKECCDQICQNAILEAATTIAMTVSEPLNMVGSNGLHEHSTTINDCRSIVLRWLASKLDPSRGKEVLRGLSNCNVNKELCVCFPCSYSSLLLIPIPSADPTEDQTACCNAMESYVSHLQKQTLITNLQALDCATLLGMKLQKSNITTDVYKLCHLSLQDFSLQAVGYQDAFSGSLD
ncbi:hypothetical protein JRO89_XS06G0174400 [Xanthoceras sorbifolium]|uniref:SPARK domain-containing protein n=1 Tax=Xanthoceras sorbifolium TaxID=99658 RepID=A0ABQ8HYW0_9ROSI|nr:hypothetical protein JRO89_XS06G0174400 [Xanthoceras sorbifolium]